MKKIIKKTQITVLCIFITVIISYVGWDWLNSRYLKSEPFKSIRDCGGKIDVISPSDRMSQEKEFFFFSEPFSISLYEKRLNASVVMALNKFPMLEYLILNNTNISNADLTKFIEFKRLRVLTLANTDIGDEGILNLKTPNLSYLNIAGTKVTDKGLAVLKSMNKLERLRLNNLMITDTGLLNLINSKDIEFLDLSETKISDKSISIISNLKKLKTLILANTNITDSGIKILISSNPENLECIDLSGTNITDEGLINIKKIKKLVVLDLAFTKITPKGLIDLRRGKIFLILSKDQIDPKHINGKISIVAQRRNKNQNIPSPD